MSSEQKRIARRRWLTALVRQATLAGIGIFAWRLMTRSEAHCVRQSLRCQDCGLLTSCRLPDAASTRQQTRREGGNP